MREIETMEYNNVIYPVFRLWDFIEIGDNPEMRFFLNDEWEVVDGEIHPDEDYSFPLELVTSVWRQVDKCTFKKIWEKLKNEKI